MSDRVSSATRRERITLLESKTFRRSREGSGPERYAFKRRRDRIRKFSVRLARVDRPTKTSLHVRGCAISFSRFRWLGFSMTIIVLSSTSRVFVFVSDRHVNTHVRAAGFPAVSENENYYARGGLIMTMIVITTTYCRNVNAAVGRTAGAFERGAVFRAYAYTKKLARLITTKRSNGGGGDEPPRGRRTCTRRVRRLVLS